VVAATVGQRGLVEGIDHGPVPGLEGQVVAPGQLAQRGLAVGTGHKQLVRPEVALPRAAQGHLQRRQHGGVEGLGARQVAHHQLHMVDQATPVDLVDLHTVLR